MHRFPRSIARALPLGALGLLLAAVPAAAQVPAQPPAPPTATLPADSVVDRAVRSRMKGPESAPVLIYLFSDFQCPFCRQFESTTLPQIDSAYVKTGKARLIFFNFPLEIHPNAWVASEAALCAGAQGKFWPMHDRLFANQAAWGNAERPGPVLAGYARELGLEMSAYQTCTQEDQVARTLVQDLTLGASGGVRGTPTMVLLREPRAGEAPQGAQKVLSGVVPFEDFRKAMEELVRM